MENATDIKLSFASDYMEGAHPKIVERLVKTNLVKSSGYGTDLYSESARDKIREACGCPDAEVHFLVGGTQTNATVIDSILKSYQGVIAAETGHISVHEAGAIEFGGHKIFSVPHEYGKIKNSDILRIIYEYKNDDNRDHAVMPGMVYISQPTEYGTLYTFSELEEISEICHEHGLSLYVDGARLAYALASPENDVALKDLASLCDVFYIGGTKCGALFGEAVVFPQNNFVPHFFSIMKQHGAVLAKGRLLGLQFDTLFTDELYFNVGKSAISFADQIRSIFEKSGFNLFFDTPTNQIFVILENNYMKELSEKIGFGFWERYDDNHSVVRFVTSWATTQDDIDKLKKILNE